MTERERELLIADGRTLRDRIRLNQAKLKAIAKKLKDHLRGVESVQCSKSSCGWIGLESDYVWVQIEEERINLRRATCPWCGGDSFYRLNRKDS